MAHICHLMVEDFTDQIGRFDERGNERYNAYDLENAVIYCEDMIEAGHRECPVQGWPLQKMLGWARKQLDLLKPGAASAAP